MKVEEIAGTEMFAASARSKPPNSARQSGMATFDAMLKASMASDAPKSSSGSDAFMDGLNAMSPPPSGGKSEVLDEWKAEKLVNFLEKTGFLDQVANAIISQSGMGPHLGSGAQTDLMMDVRAELKRAFMTMSWEDAIKLVVQLRTMVQQQSMEPSPFEPGEERPKTAYDGLKRTMYQRIEEAIASVKDQAAVI